MITKEQQNFFTKQGYIHLKQVISNDKVNNIAQTILALCCKYDPENFLSIDKHNILSNPAFHKAFINFKRNSPILAGRVYDSMQSSSVISALASSEQMMLFISSLSGQPVNEHIIAHTIVRMDIPKDDKNNLGWHPKTFFRRTM
jgi:hypothetical protein